MNDAQLKLLDLNAGYSILSSNGVELWRCNYDEAKQAQFQYGDLDFDVISVNGEMQTFVVGIVGRVQASVTITIHVKKKITVVVYAGCHLEDGTLSYNDVPLGSMTLENVGVLSVDYP